MLPWRKCIVLFLYIYRISIHYSYSTRNFLLSSISFLATITSTVTNSWQVSQEMSQITEPNVSARKGGGDTTDLTSRRRKSLITARPGPNSILLRSCVALNPLDQVFPPFAPEKGQISYHFARVMSLPTRVQQSYESIDAGICWCVCLRLPVRFDPNPGRQLLYTLCLKNIQFHVTNQQHSKWQIWWYILVIFYFSR